METDSKTILMHSNISIIILMLLIYYLSIEFKNKNL